MAWGNVYNDASLRGEFLAYVALQATHAISHTYANLRLVRRKTLVELTHGELSLDKKLAVLGRKDWAAKHVENGFAMRMHL